MDSFPGYPRGGQPGYNSATAPGGPPQQLSLPAPPQAPPEQTNQPPHPGKK